MRFLFTCIPGLGHFNPLAPLAHALAKGGHVVIFATAPAFADVVRRSGLECLPAGLDWNEQRLLDTMPDLAAVPQVRWGEWIMNNIFLDRSPRRAVPDLLPIIREWQPDMIVAGAFEYGGPLAAEIAGVPYVVGNYTVRWNRWILKHAVGRSMARLRREVGLPVDPELKAFGRYLELCFSPPSWTFEGALLRPELTRLVRAKVMSRDLSMRERIWAVRALLIQQMFARALRLRPDYGAIDPTTYFIGEVDFLAKRVPPRPDWLEAMPYPRTIFVSLGTVLAAEYPEIFDTILAGLRDEPVNLVMTMGGNGDPARFGPQPPHVRIVDFITQDELRLLLPHVDLCINHAGYGSVMEALLRGIPLVLLPLVTDAPMNAQMCLCSGVTPDLPPEICGISPQGFPILRPEKLTPAIVRDLAMRALGEPSYREAAHRMRDQLAARQDVEAAVSLIEQVAAESRSGACSGTPRIS